MTNFISIVIVYFASVQISSVEQARIIQLSMDTGSNRSVYHTARLVECLARRNVPGTTVGGAAHD